MNVSTMRAIDRFAGVPLCWLSGAFCALRRRRPARTREIRTVLVMKFFGMGSVLLSTPVLARLLARHPRPRVLYLTFSSNRDLLEKTGLPVEILTISNRTIAALTTDTVSALRRLRKASIDAVLDLEFFSKFSTLISVLSGARIRVGFDLPVRWRRGNLTHAVPLDHTAHVTRVFLSLLEAVGLRPDGECAIARLQASTEERRSMQRKLGLSVPGPGVVCINVNAGATSLDRRWRPRRFVELAEQLVREEPSRRIFFIGSAEERRYVDETLSNAGAEASAFYNCSGDLSVGELIALLERSSFLVTNDSGPMHIAAAVGTPVVAIFGPESPVFYGPVGRSAACYKALPCSPCLNVYSAKQFECPYGTRCMEEVTTNDVLHSIRALPMDARVSGSR